MHLIRTFIARFVRLNSKRSAYKFVIKDWTSLPDLDALSRVLASKRFSQNLEPVVMAYPQGKRILVLAPHPDDDIFGAGGVLLKSARSGATVKTICITTGEKNTAGGRVNAREEETKCVTAVLGGEVGFWRYPARSWRINRETQERLQAVIHEWKPDTIFLPFLADDHEDHRRASELFYMTFKGASPKCEIWAYQVYTTVLPNVIVDVTDVMERKLQMMRMYQSQMEKRDWAHYIKGLNALNSRFLKTNEPRYAETFFVVPAYEYITLCKTYFDAL